MSVGLGIPALRTGSTTPRPAAPTGPGQALVDRHGRVATDLRVSLTDRCNLRCAYCMPADGLDWLPREDTLSDEETVRLIRVAVQRLGVTDVRFTGGEPLLRRGLEAILAASAALRSPGGARPRLALTTNGVGLARRAERLRAAGLDRVNVSLDTLDRARFARITRRDRLDDVLDGLAQAQRSGLGPIKVNAVLVPGVNDDEAVPLLRWAIARGYRLRFIEQMPLDAGGTWDRGNMVTADRILDALRAEFDLEPADPASRGSAPAQEWLVRTASGTATVGVIASVTRPFCGDCDRTRLTADGQVRNCLFAHRETDLRRLMRGGADDEELAAAWRGAMWAKRAGHGIDDGAFLQPSRPMSAIGG